MPLFLLVVVVFVFVACPAHAIPQYPVIIQRQMSHSAIIAACENASITNAFIAQSPFVVTVGSRVAGIVFVSNPDDASPQDQAQSCSKHNAVLYNPENNLQMVRDIANMFAPQSLCAWLVAPTPTWCHYLARGSTPDPCNPIFAPIPASDRIDPPYWWIPFLAVTLVNICLAVLVANHVHSQFVLT